MNADYVAEARWFLDNPEQTERVRPATVEEQVWMFRRTGGAVHDSVRIVRGGWFWTEGQRAAPLRKFPA